MDIKQKNAQASLEYILLVSIILVVLIALFHYSSTTSGGKISYNQAEDAITSIAKAADDVYALSPGSKKLVWVSIPGGVSFSSVNGTEIMLRLNTAGGESDIWRRTKGAVVGTIPTTRGTYQIAVELLPSGIVQIGSGNDTSPPNIIFVSPQGASCNPVTLRANTDEPALCRFGNTDVSYELLETIMWGNALGHSYEHGVQSEGAYLYYVRCSDAFGNVMNSSTEIAYSIDIELCGGSQDEDIPPNVTLVWPADNYLSLSSQVKFQYNVSDASPILLCELIVDDLVIETVINPTRDITSNITGNLDFGTYLWSVNCTDSYGNEGNSSARTIQINATLDNDYPTANLQAPYNGSVRNFNLVRFFYNSSDDTSGIYSCALNVASKLDGGSESAQSVTDFSVIEFNQESISLSLDKGNHTWNVSCKDDSIYFNQNTSENRWIRINTTTEEVTITSCAGQCWSLGFSEGVCRQSVPKCEQNGETYSQEGDQFCTGGSQSDTCCCIP
jgi:uncharacterized protein (UPF0333 family)